MPVKKQVYGHVREYLILIAVLRQQWLRERALVLRYAYFACFCSLPM